MKKKLKIHEIPIFSSERAVSRIHLFVEKNHLLTFFQPQAFSAVLSFFLFDATIDFQAQNLAKSNTFSSTQTK